MSAAADGGAPGAADGGAPAAPVYPSRGRRYLITATMIAAMISVFMSATMINVALPDIMGAFGIGQETVHWLSTGFLASTTVAMLLNAWLVSRLGPRRVYLLALSVFICASVVAATVQDFHVLVAVRCVQGACAGILQPLTITVIYPIYPPEERGKAMGFFGMGVVFAPAFGPVLGGFITDQLGWQHLFTPIIPFCLLAMVLGLNVLDDKVEGQVARPFNWLSFALVASAVVSVLYALSNGQRLGWGATEVTLPLVGSGILFLLLILWEMNTRHPLLHLRLFADRNFALAALVGFAFGAGMFGSIYILPLFMRTVQGFDATLTGAALIPAGLVMMVLFPLSGILSQYWPPRRTVTLGLLVFAASLFLLHDADVNTGFLWVLATAALGRMGLGLIMPSLQFHGIRRLPPPLLPYGAGTFNFIRQLGGALGVNAAAIGLDVRLAHHRDQLISTQTPDNSALREMLRLLGEKFDTLGLAGLDQVPATMGFVMRGLMAQATMLSFRDGFLMLGGVFVVTLIPALLLSGRTANQDLKAARGPPGPGAKAAN